MGQFSDDPQGLLQVTVDLQRLALSQCGVFEAELDAALQALHSCRHTYADDAEFMNFLADTALYVKFNRCFPGTLQEKHDNILDHDVVLQTLAPLDSDSVVGNTCRLSDLLSDGHPLVILAGSFS